MLFHPETNLVYGTTLLPMRETTQLSKQRAIARKIHGTVRYFDSELKGLKATRFNL